MSATSFMLEIFEPGSENDVICSYFGDTAFPAISQGEVLSFPNLDLDVRATRIVHLIWDNEKINSFKTMIFTEELSS